MATAPKVQPLWQDRPISHEDDAHGLEHAAASLEFGEHKLPREQAESKAHSDYQRQKHVEAASFHLSALKGSHGAGDMSAARQHSQMYELHLKALGHSPSGPVPEEVKALSAQCKEPKVVKFRSHPADSFALPQTHDESMPEMQ